jgi:hypothetical protein
MFRYTSSAGRVNSMILQDAIDKYLSKKVVFQNERQTCNLDVLFTIRPFTIVEDPGFRIAMQKVCLKLR